MPSKHNPVSYRPPADLRDWLRALKEAGHVLNAIITDALREYRAAHENDDSNGGQDR